MGAPMDAPVPTLRGAVARRALTRLYGPPNAAPLPGESPFGRCRVLFVDDFNGGRPVAYCVNDSNSGQRATKE